MSDRQYDDVDFSPLTDAARDEVVTHAYVHDVPLAGGGVLALVTLDNGHDHTRPNTFGPHGLLELESVLVEQGKRAADGEVRGLAITGKPHFLAAGADLSQVNDIASRDVAALLPKLGHRVFGRLHGFPVPTFVFINGLALGGGLEIGLNADYRTIDTTVRAIGLPEVFLGLIPGWGGAYLLPNLIGIENALKVVIENPLKMNRMLSGTQALEMGIADAGFGSARFLEESLAWAESVIDGRTRVERPHAPGTLERRVKWDAAIGIARRTVREKIGTVPESPYAALDLLKQAKSGDRAEGFAREDEALAALVSGEQFSASIYAFDLVQKHAKHPGGAPDPALAEKVTKVGVIGAGLMATQFALLFARRLKVPVLITDVDQTRVDAGLQKIGADIDALREKGRISQDEANRLRASVRGTDDSADFADCDWVIEAVFEDLSVKQRVFADLEKHVSASAVFATNTSSLSVGKIGACLENPERLVGFHFFNPVAVMPLIEVVRAADTSDSTAATALAVAKSLRKTAVITSDTPGFAVNRVLARLLGEVMAAVDSGTRFETVDEALQPLGLPMAPSELLDLVGLPIAAHVLRSHSEAFPERFHSPDSLERLAEHGTLFERDGKGKPKGFDKAALRLLGGGRTPLSRESILMRVQDALADEVHRMLDEDVVDSVEDLDLALILGAGFPFHMGGVTPYLDRTGTSQRVFGDTFHHPPMTGISD